MEQKPVITLRQLGAKIGSRVRFVEDPPDAWRTVETEEQLDYGHMLPWIVEAAKPETTYTRKQVRQVLDAAAEIAANAMKHHAAAHYSGDTVRVFRNGDDTLSESAAKAYCAGEILEAIRAIDIDAVVGGRTNEICSQEI